MCSEQNSKTPSDKSPEPEQIYAQVNMAAKTSNVGKESKNEAEKLLTELEKELLDIGNGKDVIEDKESIIIENKRIKKDKDDEENVNSGSKCSSIGLEDANITISHHQENDNDNNENQMTTQRIDQSTKTVALQFDDVLSDVDVEYL